jgi:hypothetical protein
MPEGGGLTEEGRAEAVAIGVFAGRHRRELSESAGQGGARFRKGKRPVQAR